MRTASIPRLFGVSWRTVSFSSTAIISGCNKITITVNSIKWISYAQVKPNIIIWEAYKIATFVFIYTFLLSLQAKARAPCPPQASIGRMTLSTSLANMQPFSKDADFKSKYCGALLSPASTQGKNVYPNCCCEEERSINYDKVLPKREKKNEIIGVCMFKNKGNPRFLVIFKEYEYQPPQQLILGKEMGKGEEVIKQERAHKECRIPSPPDGL